MTKKERQHESWTENEKESLKARELTPEEQHELEVRIEREVCADAVGNFFLAECGGDYDAASVMVDRAKHAWPDFWELVDDHIRALQFVSQQEPF